MGSALYSRRLAALLDRWPGRQTLGIYRFLPIFLLSGAALEFVMIKWRVGETNFYSVYKRKQAHEMALQRLQQEREGAAPDLLPLTPLTPVILNSSPAPP